MIDQYASNGSNLMRMSVMAHTVAKRAGLNPRDVIYPFRRVPGAGRGNDRRSKFDVNSLNDAWFARLDSVVSHAASRDVVIILLLWDEIPLEAGAARWRYNPYNPQNNINGLGLPGGDAVPEFYDLSNRSLLQSQELLVERILSTVRPHGNTIIGISNEYTGGMQWHKHWHAFVQSFEASHEGLPLLTSELQYRRFSPPYTGLISLGTRQEGGSANWQQGRPVVNYRIGPKWAEMPDAARRAFWRTLVNGGHTSDDSHDGDKPPNYHRSSDALQAQLQIRIMREFLDRLPINEMSPEQAVGEVCSAGAGSDVGCRVKVGSDYVLYLPAGGTASVDLSAATGTLSYEWLDPRDGRATVTEAVDGGGLRSFTSPYSEAVLYIHR
jgi:hypothetical protein